MEGDFPLELVQIKSSGKRICGSIQQALEADWGNRTAKALFDEKNFVRTEDFHLVWWDGLRKAMNGYPKMYQVWLTKHVSEICGNNVQRYYWSKGQHSPKCKFCLTEDEYTMHICRCHEAGRDCMFHISVKELSTWLSTLGDQQVAATVEKYLLACGKSQMIDCVYGTNQDWQAAAADNDQLGWDSRLEGRISSRWLAVAAPFLLETRQKCFPRCGGQSLLTNCTI